MTLDREPVVRTRPNGGATPMLEPPNGGPWQTRMGRDMTRRTLLVLIAAWLALAALAATGTRAVLDRVEAQREQAATTEARATAQALGQALNRVLDAVETLHRLAALRGHQLRLGDVGAQELTERIIREFVRRDSFGVLQLAVIDANGRLAWSTVPGWRPMDLSDREHFRVHARDGYRGTFVSQPLVGRASLRASVQMTRALLSPDGHFDGVAVASVDPGWLSEVMAAFRRNPQDVVAVLRHPGAVLLARVPHDSERIGAPARLPPDVLQTIARSTTDQTFSIVAPAAGTAVLLANHVVVEDRLSAIYALNLTAIRAGLEPLRNAVWIGVALLLVLLLLAGFTVAARLRRVRERERVRIIDETITSLPIAVYRAEIGSGGRWRTIYASPNMSDITGIAGIPRAGAAPEWHSLVEGVHRERLARFAQDLLSGAAAETEYSVRHEGRDARLIADTATVVRREADGIVEVSGYITDVTAIRLLQRQAADNARLATLGELATGIAHEMNQPLTAALLAAENAEIDLANNRPAAVERRLHRITSAIDRTKAITDHLRRIARGDAPEPPTPVAIDAAVTGSLLLIGGALSHEGITVDKVLPSDLPPVLAQPIQLEQVLVNLLLNARDAFVQFEPDERRITIAAEGAGEWTVINVTDNAGSPSEQVVSRVFEPFFTTKPPGKGTGLGLPISRRLVEAMGGTLDASAGSDGMTFAVRLRSHAGTQQAMVGSGPDGP